MTTQNRPTVIEPLVRRHAEDAAFYWAQHDASAESPRLELSGLARFSQLLAAHLEGLEVAGLAIMPLQNVPVSCTCRNPTVGDINWVFVFPPFLKAGTVCTDWTDTCVIKPPKGPLPHRPERELGPVSAPRAAPRWDLPPLFRAPPAYVSAGNTRPVARGASAGLPATGLK